MRGGIDNAKFALLAGVFRYYRGSGGDSCAMGTATHHRRALTASAEVVVQEGERAWTEWTASGGSPLQRAG